MDYQGLGCMLFALLALLALLFSFRSGGGLDSLYCRRLLLFFCIDALLQERILAGNFFIFNGFFCGLYGGQLRPKCGSKSTMQRRSAGRALNTNAGVSMHAYRKARFSSSSPSLPSSPRVIIAAFSGLMLACRAMVAIVWIGVFFS